MNSFYFLMEVLKIQKLKKMAASNQEQIDEQLKNINLNKKIPVENELSVGDKRILVRDLIREHKIKKMN